MIGRYKEKISKINRKEEFEKIKPTGCKIAQSLFNVDLSFIDTPQRMFTELTNLYKYY